MVKSYLKFEHSVTFGQICSSTSNTIWIPQDSIYSVASKPSSSGRAIVGANEEVLIWDIKKGEIQSRWTAENNHSPVSVISRSPVDLDLFAVGYGDGKIRLWDLRTATVVITFNGHKSSITTLLFDGVGTRLVSGSKDTDIILWDLVAEAGLFKLRGHKDQITSLNFLSGLSALETSGDLVKDGTDTTPELDGQHNYLLSTSKDALVKIWDLSTQHCIETHVAQSNGECWALGLSPDQAGCITAGNDGELRVWSIQATNLNQSNGDKSSKVLHDRGSFYRQSKDRSVGIKFHPHGNLVAVYGSEKSVEIWRMRTESEIQKALTRKRKRMREKAAGNEEDEDTNQSQGKVDLSTVLASEIFVPHVTVRTGGRVASFDWAGSKSSNSVSILVATTNNQIEIYDVEESQKKKKTKESIPDYSRTLLVDMPGHRSDIRCLALSSDDRMLASASNGSLKIWNVRTQTCIRSLDCGYALCATFLPGDKIVVVGTKEGTLEIFDIASSTLLDTLSAHERDIWSLQVNPDGKSLVTGSADKSAKFWDFRIVQEEVLGTNRKVPKLTLVHTRTLKVADDILCVRFSPDGRLLALSTLDNTVKVFFVDKLKIFLTLYGHKLPVLSIDISFDSKLVVTSSADKNVRVWGLDFGDCHKAFFAHQDSILSVSFMPNNDEGNGHHFFSASKDRMIKYYDGDKFELIQRLEGHHGEIWAMIIANSGEFIVSASHDKSIRVWNQTNDQIFLEEEREKELEEIYENTLITSLEESDRHNEVDAVNGEVVAAGKQTVQTLMAGEKIAEALQLGLEDLEIVEEYDRLRISNSRAAPPQRHPVFLTANNITASAYVLNTIQKIPSASLQDALLVLSFSQLPALFVFLALWASEGQNIPLVCRVLLFMIKTHQKQIVSSQLMRPLLAEVKNNLRRTLESQKSELGFNVAGLRVLGRVLDDVGESDYVDLEGWEGAEPATGDRARKKRTFVNIA